MQHEFYNLSAENFDLLMRKNIFSYEYISTKSWKKHVYHRIHFTIRGQTIPYPRAIIRTLSDNDSLFARSASTVIYILK